MNLFQKNPGRLAAATIAAGVIAWAALPSFAQTPAKKNGFEAFRMVRTRNIFDPDRVMPAPQSSSQRHNSNSPTRKATSADYVALTGIMTTEEKTLAFFAGSQPEYNKVLSLNGSIAGATITKITPSGIEVTRDGKTVTIAVGLTVPLDNSSTPALPPGAASAPAASTTSGMPPAGGATLDPQAVGDSVPLPSSSPAPAGTDTTSTPPAGNASDVMRRMMERRQKELK